MILDLNQVKQFCSIKNEKHSDNEYYENSIQSSVDIVSTVFPSILIHSIQKLLDSHNYDDDSMRYYIRAVSKLASISSDYRDYLIENGIFPIFFSILSMTAVSDRIEPIKNAPKADEKPNPVASKTMPKHMLTVIKSNISSFKYLLILFKNVGTR